MGEGEGNENYVSASYFFFIQFPFLNDGRSCCSETNSPFMHTGAGVMITCYPYTGPNEMKASITRIQPLKRPETFVQKSNFVLHFADKQCQNESVVGGKGYSLAALTSITTNDVR